MASEKSRSVLKAFGIAVTDYEDALEKGAPLEQLTKAETEMLRRLREVTALIDNLRAKKK